MIRSICKYPHLIAIPMSVAVLLSGCVASAQSKEAPVPVLPLEAGDLTGPAAMALRGNRRYRECVAAAEGEEARLERCLEGELADATGSMERAFDDLALQVEGEELDTLQAQQQAWRQETERKCAGADGDATSRAYGTACRADRMIRRFVELAQRRSRIGVAYWSESQPDEAGGLVMELDGAEVAMQSQACRIDVTRVICSDVRLTITVPGRSPQTLALAQLLLPRSTDPLRPAETGVRGGALAEGFAEGVYGVSLDDLNVDGQEDLMVWTGSDGSYGDPSYTYFLFDPAVGQLVEATAIAEAMRGHSLSRVVDGQLFAWYRSGPCERGEKTIDVRGKSPKIVDRRDYNTCEGDKPW